MYARARIAAPCLTPVLLATLLGACASGAPDARSSGADLTAAQAGCGADGQRACCVLEVPGHGPCDDGLYEVATCQGNCTCTGGFTAISHCVSTPPCGLDGQRACCALEVAVEHGATTAPLGPCMPDTFPVLGCSGDCTCSGGAPALHHCEAVTPCGQAGQRACCAGEPPGTCAAGTAEMPFCTGRCLCAGGLASSITHCEAVSSCGGLGERSCCAGDNAPECGAGMVAVPGCAGECACGGGFLSTDRHCERLTPCGGSGERACCVSERLAPCDAGLVPVLGCSGDCTCPGLVPASIQMCSTLQPMSEPNTGMVTSEAPSCPMRGFADIHLHLFGDMAHGGAILAGRTYDATGGAAAALGQDFATAVDLIDGFGLGPPSTTGIFGVPCPGWIPSCGPTVWHGMHDPLADTTGTGTRDGAASNLGAPLFNGWPRWTSTTHQQAYWKWLERAWRGGLRLTVMHAVSNESLCRAYYHPRGTDCGDSMGFIDAQLAEAWRFQTFVDDQNGGPGLGWFRIVESPADARAVIRAGKLAVVLGIEVDNLFGCKQDGPCDEQVVLVGVQRYQALGVRHIFPIHDFDNAFGGTATWQDGINVGNAVSERHWWDQENCESEGYGFWLDGAGELATATVGSVTRGLSVPDPAPVLAYPDGNTTPWASCNRHGLTTLGRTLITALMDAHIMIDIDHMSRRSIIDTLSLTEARGYPVLAGHVQSFDLHTQHFSQNFGRHERMRTAAQLEAVRRSGGLIAAMLKDDVQDTALKGARHTVEYGDPAYLDDCRHSSKSFRQAYQYAVDTMGGPVAFGSDFNGIAGHLGPRFGSDACGGDGPERQVQARADDRLTYPFHLPGFGTFDRQLSGEHDFDFNTDGLAHVGLLPDLVAELIHLGLRQKDVDSIFRSAEAYVETWERAAGAGGGETRSSCVNRTVSAGPTCTGTASVASTALASDPTMSVVQTPAGPYPLGTTQVSLSATSLDGCEAPVACTGTVSVVDTTAPSLSCPAPAPVECAGATTAVTWAAPTAADACGPVTLDGCSPAAGAAFPAGDTTVTCSGHDAAGNVGRCALTVSVRDTISPVVTSVAARPRCLEAEDEDDRLRHVVVTVTARDACDAAPVCRIASVRVTEEPCPPRHHDRKRHETTPDFVITGPLSVDLSARAGHCDADRHDSAVGGAALVARPSTGGEGDDQHDCECGDHEHHVAARTYTLAIECTDASGNITTATTVVSVVED